jgi:hypothetical protein
MKTNLLKPLIILISCIILLNNAFAQSPESFKYQAVVRDASGNVVSDQLIALQIEILQSSETGSVVYIETHDVSTSAFGLVNLHIGEGTVQSGVFTDINWSADIHFLKVSIDLEGGSNFTEMGVSQILSVPYSLHSKTSDFSLHDEVDDADADATNELQTISLEGYDLTLSDGGGTVTLPSSGSSLWSQNVNDIYYNTGNVGIGTDIPTSKLDVNGIISATDGNSSNWNSAFAWGNHSTVGYLTSFTEADPVFTSHASYNILSTDISNWNTAYGWGNHASAGYLTSYSETDPQVGSNITNYIPKWNGSSLSSGSIYDNGSIGIGTSNPGEKLDVNGNIRLTGGDRIIESISGYLDLRPNDVSYGLILRDYTGNGTSWSSFKTVNSTTDYLHIAMNSTSTAEGLSISDNGYVGIGTATPVYDLHVIGNANITGSIYQNGSLIGNWLRNGTSIYYNSGNVGIGTNTPNALLDVKGNSSSTILFEVKDEDGNPVFSVYPDYVQVTVPDDGVKPSKHGAFIVSGRSAKDPKAIVDITRITKQNYLIGHNIGASITGIRNSVLGYEAGRDLTSGSYNCFIGFYAGLENTTGNSNIFLGNNCGQNNISGASNVFIGPTAGYTNSSGSGNVIIGDAAGYKSTGNYNVFLGNLAGYDNQKYDNVMIGANAGENNNGYGNIFLGSLAGYNESGNNKLYIENSSTSSPLIYGDFSSNYITINGGLGVNRYPSYKLDVISTSYSGSIDYAARFWNDGGTTYRRGIVIAAGTDNASGDILYVVCADGDYTYQGSLFSRNGVLQIAAKSPSKNEGNTKLSQKKAVHLLQNINILDYSSGTSKYVLSGISGEDLIKTNPEFVYYDEESETYSVLYTSMIPITIKAIQEQKMKLMN